MTPPNLTLRAATVEDLPSIIDCWRGLVETHQALNGPLYALSEQGGEAFEQATRRHLFDPRALVQIAELDGRMAGYLIAREGLRPPWYVVRRVGMILDLFVSPQARRHGVGQALFESARVLFEARGIEWMQVCHDPANASASAFWSKAGFEPLLIEGYRKTSPGV
ncbi:MAG: GNAT family N-acetyltransferase [Bradymonadia bacterium]